MKTKILNYIFAKIDRFKSENFLQALRVTHKILQTLAYTNNNAILELKRKKLFLNLRKSQLTPAYPMFATAPIKKKIDLDLF